MRPIRSAQATRPIRWAAALLLLAVLALSACSSGASSGGSTASGTSSSGTTAGGASVDKATGSPYNLGVICSCSGSNAASISTMTSIVSAWSASVNAAGGIGNHPIRLFTADDSQNPGTALSAVTTMVQQNHVIAIIDLSNVDSAFGAYVASENVPVIGGNLDSDLFTSNADFFTAGGTTDGIPEGIVAAAKTAKVDKLGVLYCSGVPICAELPPALKAIGGPAGVNVSYSGAIPNAAPNYTAPCLAAQQSGANGLFIASGPPQTLAVAQSCTAQGYKPIYIAAESSLANSSLSNPDIDGAVGEITNLPASDTSNPEIKAMDQALNTFKPGLLTSAEFNPGSSMVWAAGQLFEAAARAAHLGDSPTSAQVLAGLYALKDETLGGLTAPLTFTKGKPTSLKCWFYYQVKDGKFTNPFGVSPTCASS
jgi:branched-chain amino acid transport system substrate-binding protein